MYSVRLHWINEGMCMPQRIMLRLPARTRHRTYMLCNHCIFFRLCISKLLKNRIVAYLFSPYTEVNPLSSLSSGARWNWAKQPSLRVSTAVCRRMTPTMRGFVWYVDFSMCQKYGKLDGFLTKAMERGTLNGKDYSAMDMVSQLVNKLVDRDRAIREATGWQRYIQDI